MLRSCWRILVSAEIWGYDAGALGEKHSDAEPANCTVAGHLVDSIASLADNCLDGFLALPVDNSKRNQLEVLAEASDKALQLI